MFLKRDQGDVLLNYENEAILATRTGDLKAPFVVPEVNIRIEGPVAVVDKVVDSQGHPQSRRSAGRLPLHRMRPSRSLPRKVSAPRTQRCGNA